MRPELTTMTKNEEKKCKECRHSGRYGKKLVCWLLSCDNIVVLNDNEDACEEYVERDKKDGTI